MQKGGPRDERTERTTVTLPVRLAARLSYEARRSDRSASAVVRDALTAYFSRSPEGDDPSFIGIAASKPGAKPAAATDQEIRRIMRRRSGEILGRSEEAAPAKRSRNR